MDPQIMPIGELFSRTWVLYKQRFLPLLAIVLIGTVLVSSLILTMVLCGGVAGAILIHLLSETAGIVIVTVIVTLFLLIITIAVIWCQTALLAIVVDEELGIIEAFKRGWEYLWPMTWVLTFLAGILTTGFTLGILPVFLFLAWFSFSVIILLDEDRRGLDSLLASREYVRGYGWNTLGKMAAVWLISSMVAVLPFVGTILSILLTPFFLLYLLAMYRDLKAIKGTVELHCGTTTRVFWWFMTIIGLLLPIAGLLALLYFLLTGDQEWMPAWQHWEGTTL